MSAPRLRRLALLVGALLLLAVAARAGAQDCPGCEAPAADLYDTAPGPFEGEQDLNDRVRTRFDAVSPSGTGVTAVLVDEYGEPVVQAPVTVSSVVAGQPREVQVLSGPDGLVAAPLPAAAAELAYAGDDEYAAVSTDEDSNTKSSHPAGKQSTRRGSHKRRASHRRKVTARQRRLARKLCNRLPRSQRARCRRASR